MLTLMGVLMNIFSIIVLYGVPAVIIVCCIVFLVKSKKCSPEETEKTAENLRYNIRRYRRNLCDLFDRNDIADLRNGNL